MSKMIYVTTMVDDDDEYRKLTWLQRQ